MAKPTGRRNKDVALHGRLSRSGSLDIIRTDLDRLWRHLRGIYWRVRAAEHISVGSVRVHLHGVWATKRVRFMMYMDRYERDERMVLASTLRPTDRYLEAGAGIGLLSTLAYHVVGEDAVFAYEANPDLLPVIASTMALNDARATVSNAVLGAADDGTIAFFVVDDEFWSSGLIAQTRARSIQVPVISFAEELERSQATYLMIDIEGGEVELLGTTTLPPHVRAMCVEMHPEVVGAESTQRLLQKLMDDGFMLRLQESRQIVVYLERP